VLNLVAVNFGVGITFIEHRKCGVVLYMQFNVQMPSAPKIWYAEHMKPGKIGSRRIGNWSNFGSGEIIFDVFIEFSPFFQKIPSQH
jgi:hypothetical protein